MGRSFAKRAEFDLLLEVDTRRNVLLNASIKVRLQDGQCDGLTGRSACLATLRCRASRPPTPPPTSLPRRSSSLPTRSCNHTHFNHASSV